MPTSNLKVDPSEELARKATEMRKLSQLGAARFGASVIPSMLAGATSGPMGAIQVARQFHPGPPSPEVDLAKTQLHKSGLETIIGVKNQLKNGEIDFGKALLKQDEAFSEILKFVEGVHGNSSKAYATTVASVNNAKAALAGDFTKAVTDATAATLAPGVASSAVTAAKALMDSMGGPAGVRDPLFAEALAREVASMTPAAAAPFFAYLEMEMGRGGQNLSVVLNELQAKDGGGNGSASQALAMYQGHRGNIDKITDTAFNMPAAIFASGMQGLKDGHLGNDPAINLVMQMVEMFGSDESPEAKANKLKLLFDAMPKGSLPADLEAYENFLGNITAPNPPQTWIDAKRRLKADPQFIAWMKENNLTDPDQALKIMKRRVSEQRLAAKSSDREVARGGEATFAWPKGQSDLVSEPAPVKDLAPEEPGYLWVDDTGPDAVPGDQVLMVVGSGGSVRDATLEDVQQYRDLVASGAPRSALWHKSATSGPGKEPEAPTLAAPAEAPPLPAPPMTPGEEAMKAGAKKATTGESDADRKKRLLRSKLGGSSAAAPPAVGTAG